MQSDVHWLAPLHYYWEKLTSPSQKSLVGRFLVPDGTLCPLSLLCVGIWSGLTCARPVHAILISEVICASALLCLENSIFLELSTASTSYNLLPSLLHRSMSHKWGRMIQASHLGMRASKSLSIYIHCPVVGLYVFSHLLQEEASLMKKVEWCPELSTSLLFGAV